MYGYNDNFFDRYLRMSPERLDHLLILVGLYITKRPCRSRPTISPKVRLVVTLRYLASGDSQKSHSFNFRIGRSTISKIIHEICKAIWLALLKVHLKTPGSANEWLNVANEFDKNWNFPNCLGAIDGKHVTIECSRNAGSAFYNYKTFIV